MIIEVGGEKVRALSEKCACRKCFTIKKVWSIQWGKYFGQTVDSLVCATQYNNECPDQLGHKGESQ